VVSLTVIASGQLRLTYLATGIQAEQIPVVVIVLYGIFFAGILAGITVPVLVTWRRCAETLREQVYPTPAEGRPDASWADGQQRLSTLLKLDAGLAGSWSAALSILSPLVISIVGYFSLFQADSDTHTPARRERRGHTYLPRPARHWL
jgi:hypothetical protein